MTNAMQFITTITVVSLFSVQAAYGQAGEAKLYWAHRGGILRANLDGSNIESPGSNINLPDLVAYTTMAIDSPAGVLYFGARFLDGTDRLYRADLPELTNVLELARHSGAAAVEENIVAIAIYRPNAGVPTVSAWGMLIMALVIIACGVIVMLRMGNRISRVAPQQVV